MSSKRKIKDMYNDDEVIEYINEDPFFRSVIEAVLYMKNNPMEKFDLEGITIFDVVDKIINKLKKITNKFFSKYGIEVEIIHEFTLQSYKYNHIIKKISFKESSDVKSLRLIYSNPDSHNEFLFFLSVFESYIMDFGKNDIDGFIGYIANTYNYLSMKRDKYNLLNFEFKNMSNEDGEDDVLEEFNNLNKMSI